MFKQTDTLFHNLTEVKILFFDSKQTGMQKEKEIHLNLTRAEHCRAAQQEGASGHAMLCIQCLVPAEIKEVQNNPTQRSSTVHWLQNNYPETSATTK